MYRETDASLEAEKSDGMLTEAYENSIDALYSVRELDNNLNALKRLIFAALAISICALVLGATILFLI